jgi:hypothetical protein
MAFLEKNLEGIIYDAYQEKEGRDQLRRLGLNIGNESFIFRQVDLELYGRLDLITISTQFKRITIYELKKEKIDLGSLVQAAKYKTGIINFIKYEKGLNISDFTFRIFLIGRTMCENDWLHLFNGTLNDITIYTYNYSLYGISFDEQRPDKKYI